MIWSFLVDDQPQLRLDLKRIDSSVSMVATFRGSCNLELQRWVTTRPVSLPRFVSLGSVGSLVSLQFIGALKLSLAAAALEGPVAAVHFLVAI